jgi:hypothetical protein
MSMKQKTSAVLPHLIAGPIGHLAVNILGRAAHHGSNLSNVLAHRGMQHGMLGLSTNPAAARTVKSLAGAESVVPYEVAHRLGARMSNLGPQERKALLEKIYNKTRDTKAPVLSSLREAIGHELQGTSPTLQAKGLGAKLYAGAVDKMTGITNTPFDTGLQRAGKSMLGGAPLAGLAVADPVGTAAHVGINAVREGLGKSRMGKQFAEKTFEQGLAGKQISRAHELAADYLASPAVLDSYRAGKALRQEASPGVSAALTPDVVSSGMRHLKTMFGHA